MKTFAFVLLAVMVAVTFAMEEESSANENQERDARFFGGYGMRGGYGGGWGGGYRSFGGYGGGYRSFGGGWGGRGFGGYGGYGWGR